MDKVEQLERAVGHLPPTDSTTVLDKINNGNLKVKGNKPEKKHKVPLPEKALEEKAKVQGKTAAAEVVKEKAKAKPEKPVTPAFPVAAKINDYNFMHFKNSWLENLGWTKGMALKIERNADGSVTLRKA